MIIKETETTFDGSRVEVTGLDLGRGLILVNQPPFDVISDSTLNLFVPCLFRRALRLSAHPQVPRIPPDVAGVHQQHLHPVPPQGKHFASAALVFVFLFAVAAVALSAVLYHHALINAVIISIILGS